MMDFFSFFFEGLPDARFTFLLLSLPSLLISFLPLGLNQENADTVFGPNAGWVSSTAHTMVAMCSLYNLC